jgi:2,4-dienoyl-CoA reductase-like NADH-dependent reductase (Old Yellow Enzyme family)
MIDVSTGGIGGKDRPRRMKIDQGFQIPFASDVKQRANVPVMGVGFLWDEHVCESLIADGQVDMIALARELLSNPNWPLQAATALGDNDNQELAPVEAGWWLMKRDRLLQKLGLR